MQEYIHLEQHKENKISHEQCQQCHTIFNFGKFQLFDVPESYDYVIQQNFLIVDLPDDIYNFIFYKNINQSDHFNRPPPIFA
ncbi:MAG: hypothetical protein J6581_03235 [Apibacter sp.]|uniref:hypothetical protein n=1 Tax=Apibacter mensalis TaxID=1586267 RepID=UPI001146198D|nr:hypothetical protein [Apibacter mensalis]MCO6564440.1 hypothetical protein [Apibacter sp.]